MDSKRLSARVDQIEQLEFGFICKNCSSQLPLKYHQHANIIAFFACSKLSTAEIGNSKELTRNYFLPFATKRGSLQSLTLTGPHLQ